MQKEIVETALKEFCFEYIYYNIFNFLFTLFQFRNLPLAIPFCIAIVNELIVWKRFSKKKVMLQMDHLLRILGYIYVIVIYYMHINFYVFVNLFMILSFLIRVDWNCRSMEDHEYSTILRFVYISKTFYHFSLLVSMLCVTLKLNNLVNWSWSQTFWWYWMYLSGLIGSSLTILMILLSKFMSKLSGACITTPNNEYKTLLFGFYITSVSSLIAGIWIINTLNLLGEDLHFQFGEFALYIVIGLNIFVVSLAFRFLNEDLVDFISSLQQAEQVEQRDSSPNSPKIETEHVQQKEKITKTKIFLQKLSSAYFRQVKETEIMDLKSPQQNEIQTERNCNKKIIEKIGEIEIQGSNSKCLICCLRSANAVLMDCGHGGICYQCAVEIAQKNKECFLCRSAIKQIYEIVERDPSLLKRVISKTRISM